MKKKSGFTLAEVIIVVVIVGILTVVGVPIYRSHVIRSYAVEAQALLTEIMAGQEIFYNRNGAWYASSETARLTHVPFIGADARRNKYFTGFNWVEHTSPSDGDPDFQVFATADADSEAAGVTAWINYSSTAPQEFHYEYHKI